MTLSCRASLDLELGYLIPWTCLVPNVFYFVILFRFLSVSMALCGAAVLIRIYNEAFRCYYTPCAHMHINSAVQCGRSPHEWGQPGSTPL